MNTTLSVKVINAQADPIGLGHWLFETRKRATPQDLVDTIVDANRTIPGFSLLDLDETAEEPSASSRREGSTRASWMLLLGVAFSSQLWMWGA